MAQDTISSLPGRLSRLVQTLKAGGYQCENPDEVIPGPASDTQALLAELNALVGPVPSTLTAFYQTVGSINFLGCHATWDNCDYPDPLVVLPLTAALDEAREYAELEDPSTDYWASASGVFRIPIAPDPLHKANVSGGMWLGVQVGTGEDDPVVLEDPNHLPFTQYLELCLAWGGFLGLKNEPGHGYPLAILTAAAARSP